MLQTIEHDEIREIRLAKPPANALDTELVSALTETLNQAAQTKRAIVLSGQPGMFSAGLDVVALMTLDYEGMYRFWRSFYQLNKTLATSPVPVIAAITGHSPAGGAVMALFCDYRVAAEGAFKIGLNEVAVGLPVPPLIITAMARQVGVRIAERLVVRGALISPSEALTLGVVDAVVAAEDVIPRALDEARVLIRCPPEAMQTTRGFARADLHRIFDAVDDATYRQITDFWFGAETQSTLRALVDRLTGETQ